MAENKIKLMLKQRSQALLDFAEKNAALLAKAADLVAETLDNRGKLLIFGNGGSAAEAQHIAAEFINRMLKDRDPLPAIALTTDTSVLTSVANDYDFVEVFAKQVRGLGRPGDLAWGLSTSGSSENVLRAFKAAGELGMKRLGMAGKPGAAMAEFTDLCLFADAETTPEIQELHLAASHIICELVEARLFKESP